MSEKAKVEGQEPEKGESASEILTELVSGHREATCIAFTTFLLGGVEINFTMREGATFEGTKALLLEMGHVSKWLKELGAGPVLGRDTRETIAQYRCKANDKAQKPKQPPAPIAAAPPPAPTQAAPPPPPATGTPPPPPGQAAAPAVNVIKVLMETISFVRVTMPKDKVIVEFWRSGRKYPELRWAVGSEALMEIAPTLAAAGWTAEHFDAVGAEYQIPLQVHWIPSPKDAKYKDITKVVLIQEA